MLFAETSTNWWQAGVFFLGPLFVAVAFDVIVWRNFDFFQDGVGGSTVGYFLTYVIGWIGFGVGTFFLAKYFSWEELMFQNAGSPEALWIVAVVYGVVNPVIYCVIHALIMKVAS